MCPGGQVVKQKHLVGDRDGRHAGDDLVVVEIVLNVYDSIRFISTLIT